MNIKITSDSTCDLSQDLIEKYGIDIFPLCVVMDGKPRLDGIEITPAKIFDYVSSTGKICTTTAVNMSDYLDRFTEYRREYDAVIHFTISSEMSACYQNACLAAEELSEIYVVDSRSLSTGIGQLVISAAVMAESGIPAAEIKRLMDEKKKKLDVSFVIDTLDYLRRGGRCSSIAALGANLLSLKPCIEVRDGKMGVAKKYRGSLEKSLSRYVEDKLKNQTDVDYGRIFITNTCTDETLVDKVEECIRSFGDFREVIRTKAGCTISNHCGPNCLGILFFRK